MQQVVWNLLSNAVKFTDPGGMVEVAIRQRGNNVELAVADNGPGFATEFLPHAFERFSQADSSSTRRHSGLGLGLAIARHLVELHGGTIKAENRDEGTGAVLSITLPALRVPQPTSEAESDQK